MKSIWYCDCGIANFQHYEFCSRCGQPKPKPKPAPKPNKPKTLSNLFPKSEHPELDAEIKVLRLEGLSYANIAKKLNLTKNAVTGRIDRMKKRGEM